MTTSLYKTYYFISEKGKRKISLCKKDGWNGFLKKKKKERNDRVLVQLLKKTVVQLFDVLGKKKKKYSNKKSKMF